VLVVIAEQGVQAVEVEELVLSLAVLGGFETVWEVQQELESV
jgi:hypothetical protein